MTPTSTAAQNIGRQVRMALVEQGRHQTEVAALLGLTTTATSRRFVGRTSFRADELARIAELLDVPVSRFYDAPRRNPTPVVPSPNGSAA